MRNRPGKRERMRAAKAERMGIIAANLASPKAERPVKPSRDVVAVLKACGASDRYVAPKGFRSSIANRDNLREKSHDIGFVGPRGYHTPKDTLSKREKQPGKLAGYTTTQERNRARELSDMVKGFDRETQRG